MTKIKTDDELQRAGFYGAEGKAGLGRPLAANELPVPQIVSTDGVKLMWRGVSATVEKWVSSGKEMLDQFAKLNGAQPEQIRTFARRWGILHICEHEIPASHVSESYSWKISEAVGECTPLGWPDIPEELDVPEDHEEMEKLFGGWEPIERWKHYSREAQAILNIAAMLHQKKKGRLQDWEVLDEVNAEQVAIANINTQFETLFLSVKRWLVLGNVRPDISFQPAPRGSRKRQATPKITLGCADPAWGHLFGALACQLMFVVTKGEGLAFCTACGESYIPERQPSVGRRNFCQRVECKKKAAQRYASAAYRERKKKEGRKRRS